MVLAFAGDSTITSRVPWPFPFPASLRPEAPSPLWEAAVVLPAALLLAGTLFSNLTSAAWPVTPKRATATLRRDTHRKYHTRRGHEMPVPAVIPATRLAVQTVPSVLCATELSAQSARGSCPVRLAHSVNGSTIRGNA